ncbi:probable maltase isoform X2 [Bemisia tabaci]
MRVFLILCLVVVVRENSAEIDWWETSVIYQIFPRSFRDSDGDGIGDLKGIIEKLDYIKDLGVDAIWIQPVYRSPMVDMGYDIISFREIDPIFGTMEDMKNLIREAHKMDLLVVMDFVVNHVSDQSEWFQRSVKREEPYTDYFIWHGGKEINETLKVEPNNWASFFSPSAWKWNENRKEYYFHQFSEHQPDLNLRNVKVRYEIEEVLRFWLDLGVDGFRVDAIAYLFEAAHLLDEPVINSHRDGFRWFALDHIYTVHQPENLDILHRWREILDGYAKLDNKTRLLSVEDVFSAKHLIPYFGNETFSMAHIPFYFTLVYQDHTANATKLDYIIHDFFDRVPKNHLPNMMLESHDYYRVSTRFGADAVDAFNMLRLLLPGSTCIYYGGEIGLEDSMIRNDQRTDFLNPQYDSRDKCRGPMPWDDTNNGGFTTNKKPWVPLSSKYWFC